MRRFLKQSFPHLLPRRGYPGKQIRTIYALPHRLDAIAQFYSGPGRKYGAAADSYFEFFTNMAR